MDRMYKVIVENFSAEEIAEMKKEIGEPQEHVDESEYKILEDNGWEILEQLIAEYLIKKGFR